MPPRRQRPRRRGFGVPNVINVVAVVAFITVLSMALTGCTPPGLPEPIAPTGISSVPTSPPAAGTIVVGLDGSAGRISGFNPYVIADFSPASQAVASLVLPSAFVMGPDGNTTTDPDVVDRAEVTSQEPFTVTYTLDRKASWSDGTPITAEDFSYLRDQLLVQPGTVDPAGYRLISDIRSKDAGKTVEVEFSQPFPDWRTLFSPLLPSHLMKDFPGGWTGSLAADIPVSANRYRMTSYDPVTGQISLARNDKYWARPPLPAAVVLRLGDPTDLLSAFNRGDVQVLWLAPDDSMATALTQQVPAERRALVPTAASTQLIFNTTSGPTADPSIRRAIAAGVAPLRVGVDLTGGWSAGASLVTSQVALPSEVPSGLPAENGVPKAPIVTDDHAAAVDALAAAGYVSNGLYVSRAGQVLRLTLGYASGDPRIAAAARTIQRQLGDIGIEVDLLPDASINLIQNRIAAGTIDLALLTIPRGPSDAISAASVFGCPITSPLGVGSTETSSPNPTTETTETRGTAQAQAAPELRTGNLSGYCEPSTQRLLVDAITGATPAMDADSALWSDLPVLPLIQQSSVLAVADSLRSVLDGSRQGWAWTGPLSGLSDWPRS